MQKLKEVSGDQVEFTGYGGQWMQAEGFQPTLDFDLEMVPDKQFVTYRKGRNMNENSNNKWNPFNLVNKHFTRQTDQVYDLVSFLVTNLCGHVDDGGPTPKEDLPVETIHDP